MSTLYQHDVELVEAAIFTPKARRMFDGLFRMMNDAQREEMRNLVLKIAKLLDEQQSMNIVTLTALFVSLSFWVAELTPTTVQEMTFGERFSIPRAELEKLMLH